jgi:hypothetical protein
LKQVTTSGKSSHGSGAPGVSATGKMTQAVLIDRPSQDMAPMRFAP